MKINVFIPYCNYSVALIHTFVPWLYQTWLHFASGFNDNLRVRSVIIKNEQIMSCGEIKRMSNKVVRMHVDHQNLLFSEGATKRFNNVTRTI